MPRIIETGPSACIAVPVAIYEAFPSSLQVVDIALVFASRQGMQDN